MSDQHYFTASPAARAAERRHRFTIRGREVEVTTASGVFSADRVDKGTQVLLDHVPDPPGTGLFLDLGCGWGPIALALGSASPAAEVLAADVNERAVDLTARNAVAAGLGGVRAAPAGELLAELRDSGRRLDLIWSNPPVRIGKEALHALLTDWLPLLADGGEAWLVVGKNLGADSLAAWLASQGWAVVREASAKGFRVLRVSR
ncbi:16S rRNA methyltransferase [Actinomyces sp. Chiba101]|uniref:Methyltransferase small domain-containing protein n=1 Tax=Actinomyces denticolens TaxID=52767 RepID=A0ABY1I7L3_9ACTO|nr:MULTISPECIES: methyltransferase [Actinomyces]BAW93432.1 16S rRNA methyltransferase [Actinomyces sp. Chiba101]GAV93730.1 possible 16S rRNA methyltransferase RsmC [Actinomyces denticolens]SHI72214.1 Methyltransferase small domain-containing protein [Actinomyces denticolens]SUU03017.1 Ribosomal RNA small subunit methyltransferase C [Actinomyces denticolens]